MAKKKVKQQDLIVLRAVKKKVPNGIYKGMVTTYFFQGKTLKAILPASARQPRKGQKTIILNGWKFALKWDK